ncbi:alpha/beta fold hydrolase [Dietzia sp. SL131]|uniref:alpha/beta fold hydrolase n=1 Tax=Dietzia sp. SL131 TaxID=2995149 RepID=UPI00227AF6C3|nr:alpha/beta fold hydrolase [Dietzia sp. SL131]MCY1655822.1 alpha/beta fold hydrolase [Dietzia sp. SL131]
MTSRFLSAGVLGAVAAIATGVVASAVPLASAAPAAPVDPPGALAATVPPVDTLVWDRCLPDSARDLEVGLPRADVLCAIVPVPVDHADPDGRTIDVSVRRITASVERTGALFGNPGGPGADARDLWYSALDADEDSAVDAIRRHHDLVIVQPRGLEGSGALESLPEVGVDDHAPTVLAKWCMDTDPALVRSFTTENVVRDHELVRERMGLGRISFFGFSYGTALGMVYQTLFPDSIERMVLDSSVGPSDTWWYEFHQRQAENRHQARDYVLAWIAENDATYGLGDTPLAVYGRIRELDRTEGRAASRFLPPPAQPGDRVAGSLPAGPLTSGSVDAIATGSARVDNAALASSGAFDRDVEGAQGYFAVLDMFSRQPGEWSEIAWVISAKIHGTLPDPPSPEELEAMLETRSETPVVTSDMQTYLTILNCNETAPAEAEPAGGDPAGQQRVRRQHRGGRMGAARAVAVLPLSPVRRGPADRVQPDGRAAADHPVRPRPQHPGDVRSGHRRRDGRHTRPDPGHRALPFRHRQRGGRRDRPAVSRDRSGGTRAVSGHPAPRAGKPTVGAGGVTRRFSWRASRLV